MTEPTTPVQPAWRDDEIDLGHLIDLIWSGKWIIAGVTAAATLAGGLYAFAAENIYRGDTMIQVEMQQGTMPGLAEMELGERTPTSAEIELLRSRMVIGAVVDQLDLQIQAEPLPGGLGERLPWAGPNPRSIEVTRLEMPEAWHGERFELEVLDGDGRYAVHHPESGETVGEGQVDEPMLSSVGGGEFGLFVAAIEAEAGDRFELVRRPRLSVISGIRRNLQVEERGDRRGDTGILVVSMEDGDRDYIPRVLDAIGNAYVRQNVERRSEEAERSLEFLEEQLPGLREELEEAEQAYNDFRRDHQAVDLDESSKALLEQLVEVEGELKQVRVEISENRQLYGEGHPRMASLRERRDELESVKNELEGELGELPERQQQALRLRREVEVNTQLYTNLLNSAQELRIAQAGTVGNVRVVDEAAVEPHPVAPRKALILALSLVLGGMLGTGTVLGREMLRRGITDPDGLENRLGYAVYAVVPHSAAQKRRERRADRRDEAIGLLAREKPTDVAVEAVRSLRTSLTFALMSSDNNVMAMTSPGPGYGKTFLSVNLAWLLAESGQRVLLVDSDLRRGRLHRYLPRQERAPGLADVLSGQREFNDAVVSMHSGKLDMLTSGTLPPNPSELLMRPEYAKFLEARKAEYDLVILDTAPVMAVTDGVVAAGQAGSVFLVLRAGIATERETVTAIKRLDQNRVSVTGLVVNDFKAQQAGYRQYYYYNYDYQEDRPAS